MPKETRKTPVKSRNTLWIGLGVVGAIVVVVGLGYLLFAGGSGSGSSTPGQPQYRDTSGLIDVAPHSV